MQFNEMKAEQVLDTGIRSVPGRNCMYRSAAKRIGRNWCHVVRRQQQRSAGAFCICSRPTQDTQPDCRHRPTNPQRRHHRGLPPHEDHTFAPLLLTLMLRRRGLSVHYLGANVPLDQLIDTIVQIKSKLTIFSAQQLITAATLLNVSQPLTEHGISVAYGGRIFNLLPQIQDRIPGHYLGSDFAEAIETIEGLVAPRPTHPATTCILTRIRKHASRLRAKTGGHYRRGLCTTAGRSHAAGSHTNGQRESCI